MKAASRKQVKQLHKEVRELHTLMAQILVKLELNTNTAEDKPNMGSLIVTLADNQRTIFDTLANNQQNIYNDLSKQIKALQ